MHNPPFANRAGNCRRVARPRDFPRRVPLHRDRDLATRPHRQRPAAAQRDSGRRSRYPAPRLTDPHLRSRPVFGDLSRHRHGSRSERPGHRHLCAQGFRGEALRPESGNRPRPFARQTQIAPLSSKYRLAGPANVAPASRGVSRFSLHPYLCLHLHRNSRPDTVHSNKGPCGICRSTPSDGTRPRLCRPAGPEP